LSLLASLSLTEALPSRRGLRKHHPEGSARAQVRAVVADLRFLQGFLASLTKEAEGSSLEPFEDHPYRFAGARSAILGKVADEIEAQLGAWRGDKGE